MLTALLPGFRDIRSALVAGYMWVSAAWLIGGHFWPQLLESDQFIAAPAITLISVLGSAGSLIALSILCLLVGEFMSGIVFRLFFSLSRQYISAITPDNIESQPRGWRAIFKPLSSWAIRRVYYTTRKSYAKRMTESALEVPPPGVSTLEDMGSQAGIRALREVLYLSPRLIVAKPELYVEFDRVKGESAFRDGILILLPVVVFAIMLNISLPTWLEVMSVVLTLVIDTSLFIQSREQFRTAHSMVAHSLSDGTIASAALGDA